ncbi:MAG: diadenylate cyclase CdaA [Bradymonadales bacterium]|jgi:diadenylate cyclase
MFEYIWSLFYGFSTKDVLLSLLDIAIVWYLIYQMLIIIRGTKAVQILLGLLLITLLYFVSRTAFLELPTLHWILDKFIASFIVIVVIIFQEDIRRGLGEFGKSRGITATSSDAALGASPIEEIVKSIALLSERRIGALIAIEMDAALDLYMVQGVRIDGEITKELLVSLFIPYKANPTHDGAVIVRNNRIYSAGCFLPLSADDKIDKSLGTRHRAALGLSEATDAVVLVVSEETGIISVAYKEELTRRLSTEELRELLYKLTHSHAFFGNDTKSGTLLNKLLRRYHVQAKRENS